VSGRGIRITLGNKQAGAQFKRSMFRQSARVRQASRQAAQEAAKRIEDEGRADISAAGNFGSRWTEGFRATVSEGGGHILIRVSEDVPYWTVFQDGKVIEGKPLLWIPLDFATDAKGINARDYPGQLFRVDRKVGAPLLMSGKPAEAKYFGKEQVTIPKKFHLREICTSVARDMKNIYRAAFNALKG
jgi:hypothetical protein